MQIKEIKPVTGMAQCESPAAQLLFALVLFLNIRLHNHHAFMAFQFNIGHVSIPFFKLFFRQMGGSTAPALGAGGCYSVFFISHGILLGAGLFALYSRVIGGTGAIRGITGIIHKRAVFLT